MDHEPPKSHNLGIELECCKYEEFYNIFYSLWSWVPKYEMAQIIDYKTSFPRKCVKVEIQVGGTSSSPLTPDRHMIGI